MKFANTISRSPFSTSLEQIRNPKHPLSFLIHFDPLQRFNGRACSGYPWANTDKFGCEGSAPIQDCLRVMATSHLKF